MIKYFNKISIPVCLAFLILTSCVSTNTSRSSRTASFFPDLVNFDLSASDVELLGEMDISVKYSQYIGIIKIFELINEQEVSKKNINSVITYGNKNIPMNPALHRALYDVYIKFPDADFTVPTFVIEEQQKMFLGKKITTSARIKAYKLKI
jgi:hypothetical protein